jgi:small subunit ribosomal protein S2
MERNGIHIINLYKTAAKLKKLMKLWKNLHQVEKILFGYKKSKDIVAEKAKAANMPYITERWPNAN